MDKLMMEIETQKQDEQRERMLAYALRMGNLDKKVEEIKEEEK